jgi:hypothetical protein
MPDYRDERPAAGQGYDAADHGSVAVDPAVEARLLAEALERLEAAGWG